MNNLPKISVIIPVKPQMKSSALAMLRRVAYPADLLEVVVVEGRQPSRQRNEGVRRSSGDLLCFLDDDSLVAPDHFARVAADFSDPAVAAVGGPSLTPAGDSTRQHTFALALQSLFGGGGVRNRYRSVGSVRQTGDNELILCNLCFRREQFQALGGFDERLYPNEENELLQRLMEKGAVLLHDPNLAVHRSQRPTWRAFARQLFGYGRGRAEQTYLSRSLNILSLVPAGFVLYLAFLPFLPYPPALVPLLLYLGLLLLYMAVESGKSGKIRSGALLLAAFPLLHIAYGVGIIYGFISPRFKRGAAVGGITVTMAKRFGESWHDEG